MKLALLFLFAAVTAGAAPFERDLGHGLNYYRVHSVPADLPSVTEAPGAHGACVLDLRYTPGDAAAATALNAWLKFRAAPRTPVFILANAETSPVLLAPLAGHDPAAGMLVFGAEAPDFLPDIALKISAANERLAYDALENGGDLDALLTENPGKPRNDEARLNREHVSDSPSPDDLPLEEIALPKDKATPAKPPLIDAVLQRAVHLHRALLALKKI